MANHNHPAVVDGPLFKGHLSLLEGLVDVNYWYKDLNYGEIDLSFPDADTRTYKTPDFTLAYVVLHELPGERDNKNNPEPLKEQYILGQC